MIIGKTHFWVYIILAFVLGTLTTCSVKVDKNTHSYPQTQTVTVEKIVYRNAEYIVPTDKAKEAAELYAKVYTAACLAHRGQYAEEDAKKAVSAVYGQPVPKS